MRISDWSSDVCSSDLSGMILWVAGWGAGRRRLEKSLVRDFSSRFRQAYDMIEHRRVERAREGASVEQAVAPRDGRSEEHTSELQSLMRISYAVFCLKKKNNKKEKKLRRQQKDMTT